MSTSFEVLRIHNRDGRIDSRIESLTLGDLGSDAVLIRNRYSSVNYKDALAATGKAPIVRRFPLIGGIDACGEVAESADPRFRPGDAVIVTGYGLSDTHDGGYAPWLRVPGDWVVPLPEGLSDSQAMILGTAGFTAALAIHRMEQNGQTPRLGPVAVTGATGGVGCLATNILSGRGYEVTALSGKSEQHDLLRRLGAKTILPRYDPKQHPPAAMLEKSLWGGAIDNVGGETLAWLTRTVAPLGSIASIGLAGGSVLNTSVMPFIIRGVSLLGINSATCPLDLRARLWQRLATDLRPPDLDRIPVEMATLGDLSGAFQRMLRGETHGRILVSLAG